MGKREVTTCDVCGKVRAQLDLTHEITLAKKGGAFEKKEEVCTGCAKAVHELMQTRGADKPARSAKPRKKKSDTGASA
jgi:hypothetical protein